MFHPINQPMERGWVGRIDGDHVVHLAAQTLESFFTGGGTAREHAIYPLDGVRLLAPVLHPPAIRVFEDETSFAFANPAAVVGPDAEVASGGETLTLLPRIAAVVGADGALAGMTACAEWRRTGSSSPKDRDFAFGLGPVVVTLDEIGGRLEATVRVNGKARAVARFDDFDWASARDNAASGTVLRPGDVLAGPPLDGVDGIGPGSAVELDIERIGILQQTVALRD